MEGSAFTEIDLSGDVRFDHPLERPVNGGAADARIFLPDEIAEIVRAQVAFLLQETPEDLVAFAGMLAARGAEQG